MLSDHGVLPDYLESFLKLLSNFEIAVPLNASILLIPSLIDEEADKRFCETIKYTFPRKDVQKHLSEDLNVQTSSNASKVLPAVAGMVHARRQLTLHSTGACYRRIVLLHHIPISFWPRLLARCLSSASHFYKIIQSNCVSDMPFQELANPGDVVIGHIPCQWFYWKTGIVLEFDNRTLLFVSNLFNPNVVDDHGNRQPSSSTVGKIRKMGLRPTGKDWQQSFTKFNNGFEINVPDYILESHSTDPGVPKCVSSLMSTKIMSHILEVIDEVLREWLKGDSGLYSDDSETLQQFAPCPYCFEDEQTPQEKWVKEEDGIKLNGMSVDELAHSISHQRDMTVASTPSAIEDFTDLFEEFPDCGGGNNISRISGTNSPVGFTFKDCLWAAADNNNTIICPHHNALKLSDLVPDVVRCVLIVTCMSIPLLPAEP